MQKTLNKRKKLLYPNQIKKHKKKKKKKKAHLHRNHNGEMTTAAAIKHDYTMKIMVKPAITLIELINVSYGHNSINGPEL